MSKKDIYNGDTVADALQEGSRSTLSFIKTIMFDIAGVTIIIGMAFVSLNALKLSDSFFTNWQDILINFIPYWAASTLLDDNYYLKGTFKGKATKKYIDAITSYSVQAASITGMQLDRLSDFCMEFNNKALIKMQTSILHRRAITYKRFNEETVDKNGDVLPPLKSLNKKELLKLYNKETIKVILKAQNASVRGINENILLSNINSNDETELGKSETEMRRTHNVIAIFKYSLFMFLFSIIAVKDVSEWGWAGAVLVLFKMIWIFFKTYISYYSGYNDITINLVGHVLRKEDIIKQFKYWFDNNIQITNKNLESLNI